MSNNLKIAQEFMAAMSKPGARAHIVTMSGVEYVVRPGGLSLLECLTGGAWIEFNVPISKWACWRTYHDPCGQKIEPFACVEGLDQLPGGIRRGLLAMLAGAIHVLLRHADDPERGDTGWRKQTMHEHLARARDHIEHADNRCLLDYTCPVLSFDDDGLPHVDHAAARIALYYARKRLVTN